MVTFVATSMLALSLYYIIDITLYTLLLYFVLCSVGSAHTGQVLSMEFDEVGYNLITYGSDDTVRLWDTFSGK